MGTTINFCSCSGINRLCDKIAFDIKGNSSTSPPNAVTTNDPVARQRDHFISDKGFQPSFRDSNYRATNG